MISRPVLRYHGGKWRIAPWIISHLPPHRVYVEPFCGAASVLLRKPRSYAEVVNDLDGEVVNLFRVLRDAPGDLERAVRLTPYARAEFVLAYEPSDDPVEQARRTMFRSAAGFGSGGACGHQTGFRGNVTRSSTTPAGDWSRLPDVVSSVAARLSGVVVEHVDALDVIARHDATETLHYIDPPYPASTRSTRGHYSGTYRHEMSDDEHRALSEVLRSANGMVVLSGYACPLYDEILYPDWYRVERETYGDGAVARTEVLWLNDSAASHQGVRRTTQGALAI